MRPHFGAINIPAVFRAAALAVGIFVAGAVSVYGASATWTGATNSSWQTTTNWTPNTTPGSADTVTFAATGNNTITTTGNVSIRGILIQAGSGQNYNLQFNTTGSTLTIGTGGIANTGTGTFANQVSLGSVILGGNQSWAGFVQVNNLTTSSTNVLALGANTLTFTDVAGTYNVVDAPITGTGSLIQGGAGAISLNPNVYGGPASTFSGGVTLNGTAITAEIDAFANSSFGTGTLTLTNGIISPQNAGLTFSNTILLNGSQGNSGNGIVFQGNAATWSGNMSVATPNVDRSLVFNNSAQTFTGVFSGTRPITVTGDGAGSMVLAGSSANTFSGGVTIGSGGTVTLAKTGGTAATPVAALASTSITVNSGGTLALGTSYTTTTTNALTLAGGTFATNGFSTKLGTLTLSANSIINLGSASSVINFAASNGIAWTGTLGISGWSGSVAGGGNTELFFGTTSGGLTAAQVGAIYFINPTGFNPGNYYARILSTGEVVPVVPEPSMIAMGVILTATAALWEYRRRRGFGQA